MISGVKRLSVSASSLVRLGIDFRAEGIADDLLGGDVSNLYDILERMREASKVITL